MPLSWNEIKTRALAFSKEWEHTEREEADAKPFLVEFLNIFGIRQKDYPDNAVMVTHGMSIRLFLMRWFHFTVEEFELIANPHNCAVVVMELQDSGKYILSTPLNKHRVAHGWRLEE